MAGLVTSYKHLTTPKSYIVFLLKLLLIITVFMISQQVTQFEDNKNLRLNIFRLTID